MSNQINWATVIANLQGLGHDVTPDKENWNLETPGYKEILTLWQQGNVNMPSVKWINYYPGKNFNQQVSDVFSNLVGVTAIRSWISLIEPGYFAPLHWDVDDNEAEYLKLGDLKRYTCFISPPVLGHIMAVKDTYLYTRPLGDIYEWDNYREWHGAANAGFTPYYLFHLIGY